MENTAAIREAKAFIARAKRIKAARAGAAAGVDECGEDETTSGTSDGADVAREGLAGPGRPVPAG